MSFTIYQGETGLRLENNQLKAELAKARAEIDRLRAVTGEAPQEVAAPLQSDAYAHVASSGAIIGRRPQGPAVSSVNGAISVDMAANQQQAPQQQAQGPQMAARPLQYAPQPQVMRPAQLGAQPMAQPGVPLAPAINVQGFEGQSVTIGQYGGGGAAPTMQAAAVNPTIQARIDAARARAAGNAPSALPPVEKVDTAEVEDDSAQRFAMMELGGPSR